MKKMRIIFVTGNREKAAIAREELKPFGIAVFPQKLSLKEIQAETIEAVAAQKAKDAYAILKKPLVVVDAGLLLHAFDGFPGPYTKYAQKWFGADGVLELMQNASNRTAETKWCLAYCDGKTTKVFCSSGIGTISKRSKGKGGNWFECIVLDTATNKTLAEFDTEHQRTLFWGPIWPLFAKWYAARY